MASQRNVRLVKNLVVPGSTAMQGSRTRVVASSPAHGSNAPESTTAHLRSDRSALAERDR
jgi:hypothetical protein